MSESLTQSGFKLYPQRFLVTGLFGLAQLMISVVLNTLNPIAAYLTDLYNQDSVVVNLGGLLFVLMHPIFTFPAAFVIDTYGTKVGIGIGSVLGLLGIGLRTLVNQSFIFVILGQVVCGIGRPFILNCQAKISANWFSAQTRGGITQLLTLILNVSLILGLLIPGIFFHSYNHSPENYEEGRRLTFDLMFAQAIMALICLVPNILFQKSKPPTPPSQSGSIQRESFAKSMKSMLSNKNYILLLIGFGSYFGIFNALTITLSFLIQPWFEDNLPLAVGAVGGSPVISGILGVIILGPIQRKSGQYKKWILICMFGSLIAILLFYPLLLTESLVLVSLISAFNSFFLVPLVPIMLQLGCQLVFPVGEGTAVGMLFAMGNFCGFLLGLLMSVFVKGQSKSQSLAGLAFCAGVFLIGIVLVFTMKQVKNRQNAQRQISDKKKSERESLVTKDEGISSQYSNNLKNPLLDKQQEQNQD